MNWLLCYIIIKLLLLMVVLNGRYRRGLNLSFTWYPGRLSNYRKNYIPLCFIQYSFIFLNRFRTTGWRRKIQNACILILILTWISDWKPKFTPARSDGIILQLLKNGVWWWTIFFTKWLFNEQWLTLWLNRRFLEDILLKTLERWPGVRFRLWFPPNPRQHSMMMVDRI